MLVDVNKAAPREGVPLNPGELEECGGAFSPSLICHPDSNRSQDILKRSLGHHNTDLIVCYFCRDVWLTYSHYSVDDLL